MLIYNPLSTPGMKTMTHPQPSGLQHLKWRYVCGALLMGLLLIPQPLRAQTDCIDALTRADDLHWTGRFDDSNALLRNCFAGLSEEDKLTAFDLQARNFFAKSLEDKAKETVRQLIDMVPGYKPDELMSDPKYQTFVTQVKVEAGPPRAEEAGAAGAPAAPPANRPVEAAQAETSMPPVAATPARGTPATVTPATAAEVKRPMEASPRVYFSGFSGVGLGNVRLGSAGDQAYKVTYSLASSRRPYRVSLLVSPDQGRTFIPVENARGDVNQWLRAGGDRQITWEIPQSFTERYPTDAYAVRVESVQRRNTLVPAALVLGGAVLMGLVLAFI